MLASAFHRANKAHFVFALALALLILDVGFWMLDFPRPQSQSTIQNPKSKIQNQATLPLSFEPNAGQANRQARYLAHSTGGVLLFTPSQVVLSLAAPNQAKGPDQKAEGRRQKAEGSGSGLPTAYRRLPTDIGPQQVSLRFV